MRWYMALIPVCLFAFGACLQGSSEQDFASPSTAFRIVDECIVDADCGQGNLCSLSTAGLTVCVQDTSTLKTIGLVTVSCEESCSLLVLNPIADPYAEDSVAISTTGERLEYESFLGMVTFIPQEGQNLWIHNIDSALPQSPRVEVAIFSETFTFTHVVNNESDNSWHLIATDTIEVPSFTEISVTTK